MLNKLSTNLQLVNCYVFFRLTDLVSNNTLRSSKSAAWMVSNLDFRFEFEFIEPVVIFDAPFNLSCSTDNGSYTIFGTGKILLYFK